MNVQAHMSGQISGQVPNQPGTQLPVMSQQNGNALPQMQNLSGSSRPMDPDFVRARHFMQEKIFDIIQQKQQPQDEAQRKKFRDIVRRLDEGLFRNATSKEEYTNLDTLESRLHLLIKRPSLTNQNQRYPHMVNNNSAIGAMIPTPGMSNSGNSNVMVTGSTDSSMVPTTGSNSIAPTVNTGNIMPTGGIHGGSFNRSDGPVSNGYQQSPANFSMSSGGNISSVGGQRIASQMIPTPGFSGISNQSYTNLESSSNGGGFSTVESTMVSQPQPQRQHIVGQNNNGGGQNNMLPQLPVMSQQNGNALPQMQNLSGSSRPMDPDFVRARHFMQDKIFDIIQQKQQPQDDAQRKKFRDIVRRLDEGLFRNATSKEEYTNLDTLESRLHLLIKRPSLTNQNQRYPHMVNNNSAIGAMIPTPGGTKNIEDDIDKLTQDVVQLSLNKKDSGSNIDNSNEGEGSSHAI